MKIPVGGLVLFLLAPLFASEMENLGRQLFFDKRLSVDGTVSCASCHRPDRAFSDPNPVSTGVRGARGQFNAPSVLNLQTARLFFWDGRARSLEQQAEGPLLSPIEMGNTREELERRIAEIPEYRQRFRLSFGSEAVTLERITKAIAAYERTLTSPPSLYDDFRRGRRERWTNEHELGRQLFFGKAECARCHSGPQFTNQQLEPNDFGQMFKTPPLREAMRTAPYMHDGSVGSLAQLLHMHKRGVFLDHLERQALLRFLESLSSYLPPY